MSKQCTHPHCFAPETACHLGEDSPRTCEVWQKSVVGVEQEEFSRNLPDGTLLPWTGNAMGVIDLTFITGRAKPTIIGIIGPHRAGKTTLLAAWYLLLSRGRRLRDSRFSGSYTLGGWENIAQSLRWNGFDEPTFPVHTSAGAGRIPGLLHLALRRGQEEIRDFILTDAPGEWFRRWAFDRNANNAEGARWINDHADAFLVLVDCESLAGPTAGQERTLAQLLLQRLCAERNGRPIALVWSKSDISVPEPVLAAVRDRAIQLMPDILEFAVTIFPQEQSDEKGVGNHIRTLEWVVGCKDRAYTIPARDPSGTDPFLNYRG